MAVLKVLSFPDVRLRKRAAEVVRFDQKLRRLLDDMRETMYAEGGIGLAATQVNVHLRAVVTDFSEDHDAPEYYINPSFEPLPDSQEVDSEEGCLSVPGRRITVKRLDRVLMRWQDPQGEPMEAELDGLRAVCLQHELDHLRGRLLVDYLTAAQRERYRRELRRQERVA